MLEGILNTKLIICTEVYLQESCVNQMRYQENCPLWKYTPEICARENCPLWKLPPNEIPSSLINHKNEWKNKITNIFLPWRKLRNTTSLYTGLRYILYRMTKIQKSNESANHQVAFTCQLHKSRRTKTRQSNYKIWQICETTK